MLTGQRVTEIESSGNSEVVVMEPIYVRYFSIFIRRVKTSTIF